MSDNVLHLVPVDRELVPASAPVEKAIQIARAAFAAADQIRARTSEQVQFIDAGSNTGAAKCPHCGVSLEGWWGDAMSAAFETGFTNLSVETPCCNKPSSLDALDYQWPVAFARFAIEIRNPGGELSPSTQAELEKALGCAIAIVLARY